MMPPARKTLSAHPARPQSPAAPAVKESAGSPATESAEDRYDRLFEETVNSLRGDARLSLAEEWKGTAGVSQKDILVGSYNQTLGWANFDDRGLISVTFFSYTAKEVVDTVVLPFGPKAGSTMLKLEPGTYRVTVTGASTWRLALFDIPNT